MHPTATVIDFKRAARRVKAAARRKPAPSLREERAAALAARREAVRNAARAAL